MSDESTLGDHRAVAISTLRLASQPYEDPGKKDRLVQVALVHAVLEVAAQLEFSNRSRQA